MALKKSLVKKRLIDKFEFQEVPGSKHEALAFLYNGRKIATTRFSHGAVSNDIDDDILKMIAKEIRVDKLITFKEMIRCTVSKDDYISSLRENDYI